MTGRLAQATGQGDFREVLVRGVHGYVATYAAGRSAVLTLLAQDRVNVGRLHLEGRRASARIGELVDEAAAQAEPPPRPSVPWSPTEAPTRPAPKRTRTTRTAASQRPAANAHTTTES